MNGNAAPTTRHHRALVRAAALSLPIAIALAVAPSVATAATWARGVRYSGHTTQRRPFALRVSSSGKKVRYLVGTGMNVCTDGPRTFRAGGNKFPIKSDGTFSGDRHGRLSADPEYPAQGKFDLTASGKLSGALVRGRFRLTFALDDGTRCDSGEVGFAAGAQHPRRPQAFVGVVTSSPSGPGADPPQCTGVLLHSRNGSVVVTAAHCAETDNGVAFQDFRFSPAHYGAHPRYSSDYDSNPGGVGGSPYGVWRASGVYVGTNFAGHCDPDYCVGAHDATRDYAFLVLSPNPLGERPEDVLGHAPSPQFVVLRPNESISAFIRRFDGPWTTYGYDITHVDLQTPRAPDDLNVHSCKRKNLTVFRSKFFSLGSRNDPQCDIGYYSSGGPWIKQSGDGFLVSAVNNGLYPDGQERRVIGTPLGTDAKQLFQRAEGQTP
jgi:hypothetical protein